MHILNSQMLTTLAKYGSVNVVQNGREAVLAYVNTIATRGAFYDLIILDKNLTVVDGFATVDMIRAYESEHRKSGKRTVVCVISSDDGCPEHYEIRFCKDDRSHLLHKPVNLVLLESLASAVAAELEVKRRTSYMPKRLRQPLSAQA
jgi:CheY-like chemotaxis protein